MKKTLAILGLVAFSNAANSNFPDEQLWKFDTKTETAHFPHMPGRITPIIKADSDNELHNYIQMRSNQGNVQINEYKTHDDADNELHNSYMPNSKGNVQVNGYKSHDDADHELHNYLNFNGDTQPNGNKIHLLRDDADNELYNYYMPNNKGDVQGKSHDDAVFSMSQSPSKNTPKFIARLISFNSQEKKKDFLA